MADTSSSPPAYPPANSAALPEVRLRADGASAPARDWSELEPGLPSTGLWQVTGVAGAGVTSLVVDTAAARLAEGLDPSGLMVITASKEAAARMRTELNAIIAGRAGGNEGFVSDNALVRPIHSVAFALLRLGLDEDVRLITGAQQDTVIRELLAGQAEENRGQWPPELRPALNYLGFARQLRDFLLRAAERGVGPDYLANLARAYARPMWAGAADFLTEYRQTMALAGTHQFSASELVAAALQVLDSAPELVDSLGLHTVLVDDAQHLDPRSVDLVRTLAEHVCARSTGLAVIAGDPDQSIFRFRGASSAWLHGFDADHRIRLEESRRDPKVGAVIATSAVEHRAVVADAVRRAHLIDRVDWQDIAVIVRKSSQIEAARRGLLAAGVPVRVSATDVVLSEQPIVSGLLLGVRALETTLSAAELHKLVLGPIGGADPITLRRLLRGLRRVRMDQRAVATLAELVDPRAERDPELEDSVAGVLTGRERDVLDRLRRVLAAGFEAYSQGGSVEEVLWGLWQATGLTERLSARALRGGAAGSQADRELDAMMALFDAAGDWVERRPQAGLASFVTSITEQEPPTGVRDRRVDTPQAVSVLSAHSAAGRQWRRVVVAGVQDDVWPALGETGSLFEQEEFIDLLDRGVDPNLPKDPLAPAGRGEKLAEERRLFHHVAMRRATEEVIVTAVDAPDADQPTEPSRFIAELGCPVRKLDAGRLTGADAPEAAESHDPGPGGGEAEQPRFSVLSVPHLVAELRRAACLGSAAPARREQAIRQLCRLYSAEVPGADPEQWWDNRQLSDARELVPPGRVRLSPSKIEALVACPLRAELEGVAQDQDTPVYLTKGTLVHAFAEAVAQGVDPNWARGQVVEAFADVLAVPSWSRQHQLEEFTELLDCTARWIQGRSGPFELLGVEVPFDVAIGSEVSISGRIDRLERERSSGQVFVVDLKTGKTAPSNKAAEDNPQLFAYQLALSRSELRAGASEIGAGSEHPERGGALLVYPAKQLRGGTPTVRAQSAKTEDELDELAAELPALAAQRRGPRLVARINDGCTSCQLKTMCPAHSGRTAFDD